MDTTTAATTAGTASTIDSKLIASKSRLASSEETFLALLTTQLQNQDPLSPLDSNAFTQQLVQMTGVEQQILSNELLQAMVGQANGELSKAVGFIGKSVIAQSANMTLADGKAGWSFDLPANAADAEVSITNSVNQVVYSGPLTDLSSGSRTFEWDGKASSGRQIGDGGVYSLKITARNAEGSALDVPVSISGTVRAVETVDGVTQALIGKTRVPVSQISTVTS